MFCSLDSPIFTAETQEAIKVSSTWQSPRTRWCSPGSYKAFINKMTSSLTGLHNDWLFPPTEDPRWGRTTCWLLFLSPLSKYRATSESPWIITWVPLVPCRALMRTAASPLKRKESTYANERHKQQTTEGGLLWPHHPSFGILHSLAMIKL